MLERSQLEQFLKINGVPVSARDEEIKSVLLQARWGEKDVETALLILRENIHSHETHVDSLQKVFQTDTALKPETITALLGIDMFVSKEQLDARGQKHTRSVTILEVLQIVFISVVLATLFIVGSMWYMQMGIFHITKQ
jgi:hypothetical protein